MAHDGFSAADLLGSVIDGRFEILEKLGEGGMGAIYKARQLSVDRIVALKILLHDQRGDPISVERFRHEAYLASRLKHPNAIVIHDFGQSERGLLYIAMEFLPGETLKQRLRRVGPMPVDVAVRVMSQALRTIAEAHRMGLVHRDLKPDNVFLTRVEGDENFVKVLDFGIAKLTAVQEGAEVEGYQGGLTVQGKIYGTPNYMSPEQIRGKTVDQQSDLYSLGVIFYEVLAGRQPFVGETPVDVMMMHLRDTPPTLRSLRAEVPVELERTVLRALEKDRRARYQTADEFLEALENYKFNSGFYAVQSHLGPLGPRPMVAPARPVAEDEDDDDEQGETVLLGDSSGRSAARGNGSAPLEDDDSLDATAMGVSAEAPPVEERTFLEMPDEGGDFGEPTVFETDDEEQMDDSPFASVGGDSLDGGFRRESSIRGPSIRNRAGTGGGMDEMTMLELDDEELEEVEPSRVVAIPTADEPMARPANSIRRTAFQPSLGVSAPVPAPKAAPGPAVRPAPTPAPAPAPLRTAQGLPRLAPTPRSEAPTPPPVPTPPIESPGPPLTSRPTQQAPRPTVALGVAPRDGSRRTVLLGLTFFLLVGLGAAAVVILDPFGARRGPVAPEGPPVMHIDSDPAGIEIFDRGLFVGESPAEYDLNPTGQPHDLQIGTPDKRTFRAKVAERGGASWLFVRLPASGEPKLGSVAVTSEPAGATVKADGRALGKTPLTYLGVSGSPVTFELELSGQASEKRQETPTEQGAELKVALKAP
jgi:serine/threonine protein kinase